MISKYYSLFKKHLKHTYEVVLQQQEQTIPQTEDMTVMSVGQIVLNSDDEVIHINTHAAKELRADGVWKLGSKLTDLIAVRQNSHDLLESALERIHAGERTVEFVDLIYIKSLQTNDKFFIKGQMMAQYRHDKLDRIFFYYRNIENELTQDSILNLALSRTGIFPWFFNMERNLMIIDERWFDHLGYERGDCTIATEDFAARVHPDDRNGLMSAFAVQLSGKLIPDTFTYRLRRADGTWEWFEEMSIYLGETESETPYRIVGVCQSIQEHKDIEASLIAARDKAQESDRLKSAFLANMSHEIRTPLNAIVGFSGLLTSGDVAPDGDEAKEFFRLIDTNSQQLLILISDILDLSKIESNAMEFNIRQQSLIKMLNQVKQARELDIPKGVELHIELQEQDIILSTDPLRLKQVADNLLNNAVKFTHTGSITLGYRPVKEGDKEVEIYVCDTGDGMTPEQAKHIFERFYKADSFAQGVGLGLSICKTIMEYLGGSISCTSEPEKGTCFTVRHPLMQNNP